MNYLQAFLCGICFVLGALAMVVIFAKGLRRAEKSDREWMKAYHLRVEALLYRKAAAAERMAELMEKQEKREKDKEFHQ